MSSLYNWISLTNITFPMGRDINHLNKLWRTQTTWQNIKYLKLNTFLRGVMIPVNSFHRFYPIKCPWCFFEFYFPLIYFKMACISVSFSQLGILWLLGTVWPFEALLVIYECQSDAEHLTRWPPRNEMLILTFQRALMTDIFEFFLLQCLPLNATLPHWWLNVNIAPGNDFISIRNKALH